MLGEKVETLLDEYRRGGEYNLEWNSSEVAPGIYLIRMDTDKGMMNFKLIKSE